MSQLEGPFETATFLDSKVTKTKNQRNIAWRFSI